MHSLLKTIRIYAWSRYLQKLVSVGTIRRFIFNLFQYQNFSRHKKAELLRKWIALVLQVKFPFIGCVVKANTLVLGNIAVSLSSQLIVLVFTKQPSVERYLAIFFCQYFCELLENSNSASKYFPKSFRNFTTIYLWQSLMLVKLQAFTGATTGSVSCTILWHKCFPVNLAKFWRITFLPNTFGRLLMLLAFQKQSSKKGVLENFAKFRGKHLWFAKFPKTPCLQNTPGRLLLAFSCSATKMGYYQQCLEKLRWILIT